MDIPTIQPPGLKIGDTVCIVAPASTIEQRDGLNQGIETLESMGFRVRYDERIFQSSRYLAGDDSSRAEELIRSFKDSSIQAVIALRGGYGCARLIPHLTRQRLRPHPKIFMGFSDLTTLHLFFRKRFGWITIHGPMAMTLTPENLHSNQHLLSLLTDPGYRPTLSFENLETMETWTPGVAEGELTGGCLSIIATSIGTSYEIKTEGRILFLEDHGEPPYRLDRILTHLRLAGKLQSAAGLLLGSFSNCDPTQGTYSAKDVLREILADLNVPTIAGFPAGHSRENWALPLGARVRLDANTQSITLIEPAIH
jgi:muramoyltetrapeptide carboxypeptidase